MARTGMAPVRVSGMESISMKTVLVRDPTRSVDQRTKVLRERQLTLEAKSATEKSVDQSSMGDTSDEP